MHVTRSNRLHNLRQTHQQIEKKIENGCAHTCMHETSCVNGSKAKCDSVNHMGKHVKSHTTRERNRQDKAPVIPYSSHPMHIHINISISTYIDFNFSFRVSVSYINVLCSHLSIFGAAGCGVNILSL